MAKKPTQAAQKSAQKSAETTTQKPLRWLDWLFVGTLLAIFAGIVLHAPIAVGFSTLFPQADLVVKSWKEILMGIALVVSVVVLTTHKKWAILQDKLIYYIALFAALNLLTIPLFYTGFEATVAGLFINLRYFLFFVLVYVALKLYPKLYRLFITTFVAGALVVLGFAILQVTVLPNDFLKYLGYGESTIMPYLTVDQNEAYVRINSTLRGPNPLGIYALIALAVVLAAWLRGPRAFTRRESVLAGILAAGSIVALWASYSRSAALAAAIAVVVVVLVTHGRKIPKYVWIVVLGAGLVLTASVVTLRDTQFVSQVILHEDPHEESEYNSNDGHADSLVDGTERMLRQPLGAGIGSTGSASLYTDDPVIIENQYLFVAHEVGWVGLALFITIICVTLKRLWMRRAQWLALAVFASGLGIALAGLIQPVWVDDTVSIVWWGLAAIALALPVATVAQPAASKAAKKTAKKVKKS